MSSGVPKESNASLQEMGGLAVRSSSDMCKGCRRFCSSLVKTIAANRLVTAITCSLPMIAVTIFLIYIELYLSIFLQEVINTNTRAYNEYKMLIFSPLYTLAAINYLFGVLALLALKCEYQNLLRFSAFVYRGIAHWILLTVFLLMIPIAGYLPVYLVLQVMLWSFVPASLWLFVAAVMTGHSDLITVGIESRSQALRDIGHAYSAETQA